MFDIESNGWINFEMAGVFDGYGYTFCDSLTALFETLFSRRNFGRTIFAHNGGRFDFLFLFQAIQERGYSAEICLQAARAVAIKVRAPGKRNYWHLQDSFALLPYSLQTLSDSFEPLHRKKTAAIDFERERVEKTNAAHREYLEHDCRCLWEVIEKYRSLPFVRDVGLRLTRSSTSLAAWRTTLQSPIKMTPDHVQDFVRRSYAGGRCEIFRETMENGFCYDANSLYPAQMKKRLPTELICESRDPEEFGFHDVTVHVPDCYMPILWKKTPKLVFPTGTFRGVYFSEELALAVRQGARILRHHAGYHFDSSVDLFRDFIDRLYTMRLENPTGALNIVAKDLMNHCYGKTAEREEKTSLRRVDPLDPESWPREFRQFHGEKMFKRTGLIEVDTRRRSPHMLCHIASAITAYGRVHMAEKMYLPYQDSIRYTDTDSGFVPEEIPTGQALGELKKEYQGAVIKFGLFILPKGYYLELNSGKIIRKLKGFRKSFMETLSYDDFRKKTFKSEERVMATLKSALIRENTYLTMENRRKSVLSLYDKRKMLPDGNSRPWHIDKKGVLK